jgi:hypothetical protein
MIGNIEIVLDAVGDEMLDAGRADLDGDPI